MGSTGTHIQCVEQKYFMSTEKTETERMTDGVEITDEMLLPYSDEVCEKDDSRPVLIEPGGVFR